MHSLDADSGISFMEILLPFLLMIIVFLVILNQAMNWPIGDHIRGILLVFWLAVVLITFRDFGWRSATAAITFSLIEAYLAQMPALRCARFLKAHVPRGK